jgi:GH24 family phage-related lysozyme (muramidase)
MRLSGKGILFLRDNEGKRLKPYKDSRGYLTIGIGHLCTEETILIGSTKVNVKNGITEEQCGKLFAQDVTPFESLINRLVKVPLTQEQFDALVSFTFNIGGAAFNSSTLLRRLNTKDYKLHSEFLRWTKQPELIPRRTREANLFCLGSYM